MLVVDTVSHQLLGGVGTVGVQPMAGLGVLQNGPEASPLAMPGDGYAGEIAEGGIEVDELDQAGGPARLSPRVAHDQRNPRVAFEVRVLAPARVIAELPSVVSPENHDGFVGQTVPLKGIEDPAHAGIDVAGCGCIAVKKPLVGGHGKVLGSQTFEIAVFLHLGGVLIGRKNGVAGGNFRVGRHAEALPLVKVPVFGGSNEGQVGLAQANREKEGFVLVLGELLDDLARPGRSLAIDVSVVVNVGALRHGPLGRVARAAHLAFLDGLPELLQAILAGIMARILDVDPLIPVHRVHARPGMPVVDFAHAKGPETLLAKMLVDGLEVGVPVPPAVHVKGLLPGEGGVEPAHDR